MRGYKRRLWLGAILVLSLLVGAGVPVPIGDDARTLAQPTQDPDLVVEGVTWSPEVPDIGDTVTFTITIRNQGLGPADSSRVAYYIDDAFQSVTKWSGYINKAERVPEFMRRAFTHLRSGRPGPVLLQLPRGLGKYDMDEFPYIPVKGWKSQGDPNGHGTHLAGIIGNSHYEPLDEEYRGTAPGVNLVAIRVLGEEGGGSYADVLTGINWVVENKDVYNIRVLNISMYAIPVAPYWADPYNLAVMAAWDAGIVVVRADQPERAVRLQHAPALCEPGACEAVVLLEGGELVPRVVDAVDARVVGTQKLGRELKIVGRICEDQVYTSIRYSTKLGEAISHQELISGQR